MGFLSGYNQFVINKLHFLLGVVKHIIPAVASTNAVIAGESSVYTVVAMQCNDICTMNFYFSCMCNGNLQACNKVFSFSIVMECTI